MNKKFKIVQLSHCGYLIPIYNVESNQPQGGIYHQGSLTQCTEVIHTLACCELVINRIGLTTTNFQSVLDLLRTEFNLTSDFALGKARKYIESCLANQLRSKLSDLTSSNESDAPPQPRVTLAQRYSVQVSQNPEAGAFMVVRAKDGLIVFYGTADESLSIMSAMNKSVEARVPEDAIKAKLSSLELDLQELGVRSISTSTAPGKVDKQQLSLALIGMIEAFLAYRKKHPK